MNEVKKQIRVLHLLSHLVRGGLETWLMEMMRYRNPLELQIDVCQISTQRGAYEDEFVSLGGKVIRCPLRKNLFGFNKDLRNILRKGDYDIFHSHHYFASGYFLRVASSIPKLKLIAHLHPTADMAHGRMVFPRPLYQRVMKQWIKRYADAILGASKATLEIIWGPDWQNNPKIHFQPNGINLKAFEREVDSIELRKQLGLEVNSKIVLTIGRHVPHKNHILIPEIAKFICQKRKDVYFVINGVGPLKGQVEQRVSELGLTSKFRFLSGMPDLVPLWKSSNVFLFPSLMEGFGVVVIEAAAAGLPIVAHEVPGVTESAAACHKAILLPVGTSAEKWSESVFEYLDLGRLTGDEYKLHKQNFKFATENSLRCLLGVYNQLINDGNE